ncbi:hypothetical protein FACS1894198_5430 [Clostridia bacterium]|nr:hypothetical protein FACS1894198_5430 [Clostridia bacterium]
MKSKKNLQKVLCIALVAASVSSVVAPVSYGVRPEDDVENGIAGLSTAVRARLLR